MPLTVQELNYEEYLHHQQQEISPEKLWENAANVRKAGKFYHTETGWKKTAYQGYAVVSMVAALTGNERLYARLQDIQSALTSRLRNPRAYYLLPLKSFHQTVANTLSAEHFRQNILDRGLGEAYPGIIGNAFEQIPPSAYAEPIRMKLIGLSIFQAAIGMLGVFDSENDFWRILNFRDNFYENTALNALDIVRTRPFIGHITLAYIEEILGDDEKHKLAEVCTVINEGIKRQNLVFSIRQTALRSYQDLSCFRREDHYPIYKFTKDL